MTPFTASYPALFRKIGSAALVLSLLIVPLRADYQVEERISQTHPLSPSGRISLENVNGGIRIRSWDRAEVKIEATKQAATEEELRAIQLTIQPSADRLEVQVKLPRRSGWFKGTIRAAVDFEVLVPRGARLDNIAGVNSDIRIEDVDGDVDAQTVNGTLRVTDVKGNLELSTVNGSAEATFATLEGVPEVELEAVNGGITVNLPKTASATVDLSTVNGGVECEFELRSQGRISNKAIKGDINGGGTRIAASTVNGGVRLLER